MDITLFRLICWTTLFLKSCDCKEGFTKEGNHWMENGKVPHSKAEISAASDTGYSEFEQLYQLHDAAALAVKYTDDCVYIHEDLGILRGNKAVQNGYQELFKSKKASVKVELLEASDMGTLGDGYMYFIAREHFYDKNNNKIGESTLLGVLKHVEDGYQVYLNAEITDLDDTFVQNDML